MRSSNPDLWRERTDQLQFEPQKRSGWAPVGPTASSGSGGETSAPPALRLSVKLNYMLPYCKPFVVQARPKGRHLVRDSDQKVQFSGVKWISVLCGWAQDFFYLSYGVVERPDMGHRTERNWGGSKIATFSLHQKNTASYLSSNSSSQRTVQASLSLRLRDFHCPLGRMRDPKV